MAATESSHFPPSNAYTTPPNSQGYAPYPAPSAYSSNTYQTQPQTLQQQQYQQPQIYHPQFHPMDSSSTTPTQTPPNNISPTSPSLPLANRHGRAPKSPMYIPAALRPTERPHRASPLTPPRSVHGSTESLEASGHPAQRPLSRRSTSKNVHPNTSTLVEVNEDSTVPDPSLLIPTLDLPDPTGPPTRTHWKPDSNAPVCDAPVCTKRFSLFERRHHCRHCGNIFCGEHSTWNLPLDQNADFHPNGLLSRGCGHCWGEYNRWIEDRTRGTTMTGTEGESTPIQARKPSAQGGQRGSIAQSLTRDWNWSTF